jgi:hypothetical protein
MQRLGNQRVRKRRHSKGQEFPLDVLRMETNKSIVDRPPQEWGNTATKQWVVVRGGVPPNS